MKIYEQRLAPNTRRVRMFLAEKGLLEQVEFVELDLRAGDNISADFRQKNALAKVPVLELDDGTFLSESVAICRYFEALTPEPALMGTEALEQANIEMWQRRCELYFMNQIGMGFQHTSGIFADRMTPIKEWGQECIKNASKFFALLDQQLGQSEFVAGEHFSIADITAFCAIGFARVVELEIPEDMSNLQRWYSQMRERPSSKA